MGDSCVLLHDGEQASIKLSRQIMSVGVRVTYQKTKQLQVKKWRLNASWQPGLVIPAPELASWGAVGG